MTFALFLLGCPGPYQEVPWGHWQLRAPQVVTIRTVILRSAPSLTTLLFNSWLEMGGVRPHLTVLGSDPGTAWGHYTAVLRADSWLYARSGSTHIGIGQGAKDCTLAAACRAGQAPYPPYLLRYPVLTLNRACCPQAKYLTLSLCSFLRGSGWETLLWGAGSAFRDHFWGARGPQGLVDYVHANTLPTVL